MRLAAVVLALASFAALPGQAQEPVTDPGWGWAGDLDIGNVTETSADLHWTFQRGCGELVWVVVRHGDQEAFRESQPARDGSMNQSVAGLVPGTAYDVQVGSGGCGIGGADAHGSFTTLGQAPMSPGYAYNVAVDDITTNSAAVHWSWVQGCDPGDVFVYAIPEQQPYRGQRAEAPDPWTRERQFQLTELFPGTEYAVRIEAAESCDGQSAGMAPISAYFTTLGAKPPNPDEVTHVDPHMGWGEHFTVRPGPTTATFEWEWTVGCSPDAELRVYPDVEGESADGPEVTLAVDVSEDGPKQARVDGLRPTTDYWAFVVVPHQCDIVGGSTDVLSFRTLDAGRTGQGAAWSLGALAIALALAFVARRRA